MFSLLICFAIISCASGQFNFGDGCPAQNTKVFRCINIQGCPSAQSDLWRGVYPKICGFEGIAPKVCCAVITVSNLGVSERKCAQYHKDLQKFTVLSISGGEKVFDFQYPHMAALGFGNEKSKSWQCGGTVISERFVVTAAHCLFSQELGPVQWVRLGGLNLAESDSTSQNFKIIRIIKHPDYKAPSVYHDIALLELDRKIDFNQYVKPACLHKEGQSYRVLTATGWGLTEFAGEASDQLQKVDLEHFSYEICSQAYRDLNNTRRLKEGLKRDSQMCAGSRTGIKDTCPGDSGGPLQSERNDGFLYNVIGITSFGKACGIANSPGVYTRVSHYVPWIQSIVWP